MYQWQPSKWIKWAFLAGLPLLAAHITSTDSLVKDITMRAQSAAGDGTKVELDGRDAKLSGSVIGQEAFDAAVKAVANTYGVRTIDASSLKIVAPVALAAPTIESLSTNNATPEIKGTWPQDQAKTLAVTLNSKAYKFGTDAELQSSAGSWTLKPAAAIPDGAYDVTAEVSDGGKMITASIAPGKLLIDTVAPAAPTLAPLAADAKWPFAITGTWPEEAGSGLAIKLADTSYALGKDEALKSDGKGTFTFDPKVDLKPGSYDLNFTVNDAVGNVTPFVAAAAIIIPEVKAAAEPPKPDAVILAAPSVTAITTNTAAAMIEGTYPAEAAKLSVDLAGKTYTLGTDKELSKSGEGKWMLMLSAPLADGDYQAIAKVENADGQSTTASPATPVIVDTVPPAAPTIDPVAADTVWPYAISGSWPEGDAKSLNMELAGKSYELGAGKELISDGKGKFTFVPAVELAPGKYDLTAKVADAANNVTTTVITDAVVIAQAAAPEPTPASPPPAPEMKAPTVEVTTSDSDHPTVKGTWAAGVAKGLTVSLDGTSYKLGKDFALLSDASGNWSLKPTAPMVNGVYDVIVEETGGDGKTVRDATKDELTVNVAPPPPAPPAGQPYDCVATIARVSAVFPVRFAFNSDRLKEPYSLSVNQYAALLKDPRCLTLKVQVEGHADYFGSEKYNQDLSERRARNVIDALSKAGIDVSRLTAKGYSKDKPLDPATTITARMKNRRVEFTTSK
jgi:outer membrane protein OmpA-like peptidoglycan-associated protein